MMFDISLDSSMSALYLKVTNERELSELRREFDTFVRTPPNHRATPEDASIKIHSGPEGNFATILFRSRS
jgi:hypothetical protein